MSKIRVDELINQSNSGPTLAVEGLRVPTTKSLLIDGIISLNGDTGLTGQVLSRTSTGVGWSNVPLTDNNTTYTLSTDDGANPSTDKVIRLTAGGSGSGSTEVVLVAGNNVSLTRNSGRIIIDSSFTDTNTVTRLGVNGQNYTDGDINFIGTGAATITQSGRTFTINVNDDDTTYTGESGVTITGDNKIKIGQPVGPNDPVTFQQVTVSGNLIVQGTTTTSNTVTVSTQDKFINLNDVLIPTDAVADGGGIRLKGDSPHTILWSNTEDSWTSSENFDLASGRSYKIDGDEVITNTGLGNVIRGSSLESVGVLSAGRWEAQTIDIAYGGTGQTNANDALNAFLPSQAANASKYLTTDGQDTSWAAIPPTYNGWSVGDNSVTTSVNSNDIVRFIGTGSALVTLDNVNKRLTFNADNTTYNLSVENQQEPNRKSIRLTDSTGYAEEVVLSAGTGVTLTRTGSRLEFSVDQDLSASAIPTFTGIDITGTVNATTYTGSAAQLSNLTGVPNGVYGSSGVIPVISVDPTGRITNISTAPNTGASGSGGIVAGGSDYSLQYNNNGGLAGSDKIKFEPIQGELTLSGYLVSDNIVSTGATITELQALDYIKFPSKTISERDYLNVLNGSVIYNNVNNRLEMYQDGEWIPIGGITQLGDLLDVQAGHPGDGQVLSFSSNGNRWVPTTVTAGGGMQQNSSLVVNNSSFPSGSGSLIFNPAQNILTYTPPDITSFISNETDPIFVASPSASITNTNISNWNSAYNWGDHSSVGYLQATNTDKANWNLAYSWGNHASAGYITAEVDTLDSVTNRGNTTINNVSVGQLTAGGLLYPNTNGIAGQVLTSDGAGNIIWQNTASGGSNVTAINQLTDVSISAPSSGDVLYFNGANWTNGPQGSGGYGDSDVNLHLNTSSATAGQILSWNGNDFVWVNDQTGGSSTTTFAGLTDTPANYVGQGGKYVAVNSGATALEFITPPTIPTTLGALTDVDVTGASNGKIIKYNGSSWEIADDLTGGGGVGGANVTISDDPPTNPSSGDLWWESDKGRLKIRYSSVWVDANPVGGGGGGSGSTTSIISPVAYAVVSADSAGSGTGMSWGAYNSSTGQMVFTFDTAQPDANYYVHTNREQFATHNIEILSKTTTGFTTKWTNADTSLLAPSIFKGVLIVYASTPTLSVGGGSGGGTSYANSDVDSHLNKGSATANQVLSWNGSDYAWVAQTTDTDTTYTAGTGINIVGTNVELDSTFSPTFAGLSLNGTALPFTDGTYDLGSAAKKWRFVYTDGLVAGGLTYPTSNGTSGQVLTSNGSGGVTWTTVSGGGGGGGIALTNLSVSTAAAGTAALAYDNTNGVFTYTPPDLSGYSTFSGSYADLTNKPTLFSGSYADLTNKPTLFSGSYADLTNKPTIPSTLNDLTDVDAVTGAANGKILKYNGSSWELADDLSGSGGAVINNNAAERVITGSATAGELNASDKLTLASNGIMTLNGQLIVDSVNINGNQIQPNTADTNLKINGSGTGVVEVDGKIYYSNVFSTLSDLPSASTYHGMFAHVHATGKGYFAHGGSWIPLANESLLGNASNWDTAYSWGNHASSGYLTSLGAAAGVTNTKISNWDTAYSWGDHSQAGYSTGTNLSGSRTSASMKVTSSTGNDVTFGVATSTLAGPMSANDKAKLDGIASGATNTAAPYYTSAISVGDGGLTQRNFTTTLKNKLDGIATGATSYSSNQATNTTSNVTFGSVYSSGNVTAYSDVSLKENISTISDALSKVTKLRGVSYDRKDTKQKGIGVIAQEIEKVLPEVVETTEYKSVAYGNIVGVLIEAIKELKTEVDDLKKELRNHECCDNCHGGNE